MISMYRHTDEAEPRRHRARMVAIIGALCLAAGMLAAGPAMAQTDGDEPAGSASQWLSGELESGLMHFPDTGDGEYDDYGMSLDVLFALQAADRASDARTAIIDAVSEHINEYSSSPTDQDGDSVYAGSTAKAIVAAHAADGDPRDFGGVDLVERLESTVGDDGKITDDSEFGDFANTIGQAYATEALAEADSDRAASVRDFLLTQQCDTGAFVEQFGTDCDEPSLDTTSMAVTALSHADAAGMSGIDDAIDNAAGWLAEQQDDNGSFGSGTDLGANSNSTGVAAHALALTGNTDAAGDAAEWITQMQVTESTGGELDEQVGAIAYNSDALTAATADGIADETLSQWRGATAQGLLGLMHLPTEGGDVEESTGLPGIAWGGIVVLAIIVVAGVVIVLVRRRAAA